MSSKKRTIPEMLASTTPESSGTKPLPKISVSTLRGFQLLDSSSSDDISSSDEEDTNGRHSPTANPTRLSLSNGHSIPCRAFDEMCEEYFRNEKGNVKPKGLSTNMYHVDSEELQILAKNVRKHSQTVGEVPPPPSHLYFFSTDARIRNLVRTRLPNFCPLGDSKNGDVRPAGVESIDYMSQFSKVEGASTSQNTTRKGIVEAPVGATKVKKRAPLAPQAPRAQGGSRKRKAGEKCPESSMKCSSGGTFVEKASTRDSVCWLNPKSDIKPKNVGKRRVHAGKSSGFWYTAEGGRKVYVSKTGDELSGTSAYRQYKKENGTQYTKKSKWKNTGGKKK